MLNLDEINNTIEALENSSTTFETCSKLASLYIVRDKLQNAVQREIDASESKLNDRTERELSDILPQYKNYCEIKRKYQLNEVTEKAVYVSMADVCKEIKEFMQTLYSSTDTPKEREMIKNLIDQLREAF